MLKEFVELCTDALDKGGYALIVAMMAIESSIIPLPSELIIPPAAHLSDVGRIPLSIPGIIIAGTIGSWIGSSLMYWPARIWGRPLFQKYGWYFGITPAKLDGAERWSKHYGSMGIFVSRLLPVVRHLIGIPAGVVRMDYLRFSIFTMLGSAIWCCVLCYVGVKMGQDEKVMQGEMHRISLWLGCAVLVLAALYYFFVHRQMKSIEYTPHVEAETVKVKEPSDVA